MEKGWKYIIGLLVLVAITIWLAVLAYPGQQLSLIACDVGQGDSILAVYGETQILVDGGPNDKVLECLHKHLPFWDREIELIILTHPQKDHYGGLIDVFRHYKVDKFLATPIDSGSQGYQALINAVGGSGAEVINPTIGMVIRLDLIYLDILHPSEQYVLSKVEGDSTNNSENGVLGAFDIKGDLNDYSVVTILRLGEFDALLTGDIGPEVSDMIAETLVVSNSRTIEYIKTPHHGSKNGLTRELLEVSMPEIAVISVGKNPWGHPHQEILDMLRESGINIFRTV
ncbi:MAG: MBL fold metallo-hydrolase, partial [Thermodesulfovibrionia bacterium]|nr:MBL fold metallo-hydrolase [Thermodesulfovibrionia bacterium]